jgi:hypothetical protein
LVSSASFWIAGKPATAFAPLKTFSAFVIFYTFDDDGQQPGGTDRLGCQVPG